MFHKGSHKEEPKPYEVSVDFYAKEKIEELSLNGIPPMRIANVLINEGKKFQKKYGTPIPDGHSSFHLSNNEIKNISTHIKYVLIIFFSKYL